LISAFEAPLAVQALRLLVQLGIVKLATTNRTFEAIPMVASTTELALLSGVDIFIASAATGRVNHQRHSLLRDSLASVLGLLL
jgi:hypothetical protein